MSEALKQSAERLVVEWRRRAREAEFDANRDHFPAQNLGESRAYDEAAEALEDAIRFHSDSAEPFDDEWLQSAGFEQDAIEPAVFVCGKKLFTYIAGKDASGKPMRYWQVQGDFSPHIPRCLHPTTRGGVRLLCRNLGLELKEQCCAENQR